ncbi:MAG: hypothetical protein PHD38_08875 [Mesotoga sp.]|uniref:hypothetical protein n=1 Tax=unclassified Mesotoga TaxID=1184398 RepID=UPI000EF28915|nr:MULTISPECIES: hypothetical protein [unclassified Mesotoga]MDI9368423.1 hypothetical protein [Thermotogota bacterium]MDD2334505.1 hypothetical protein [Mesotoga sp.]MDD3681561.1 hypothetical protein [Mesotoga sp.]MDD4207432.1 hypothetical protein [Mesotoga sp.]MDD4825518.1 hypothetical protein [Mesotoga sp.]
MFIFLALLISLLLITNIDALLNYRQVQRRMENLQKEYDALKREIEIRESELELLRGLVPGSNDGGTR